jgi:hypothetical protein
MQQCEGWHPCRDPNTVPDTFLAPFTFSFYGLQTLREDEIFAARMLLKTTGEQSSAALEVDNEYQTFSGIRPFVFFADADWLRGWI